MRHVSRRSKEFWDHIAIRYSSGESSLDLANECGVTVRAVQRQISKRKLSRPPGTVPCFVDKSAFEKPTEDRDYWLGFLLADGCILDRGPTQKVLVVQLAVIDVDHLHKLKGFLGYEGNITGGTDYPPQLRVHSNPLSSSLSKFGIVPRKTDSAEMLDPVVASSPNFWRGVIDGDGCLYYHGAKSGKHVYNSVALVGSKELCSQFRDFVQVITPTKATVRRHSRTSMNLYNFYITGRHADSVIGSLYGNSPSVYLERKYKRAMEMLGTVTT